MLHHYKHFVVYFLILLLSVMLVVPTQSFAKTSNDPFVNQWAYTDINLFDAWEYTVGSRDVVVAIIDNGFDIHHPDLQDNVWKNKKEIAGNGIDDDKNGYIDDVYGWNFHENTNDTVPNVSSITSGQKKEGVFHHGTVVAGLIGAVGNNGKDGAGINWTVRLMNLKVLGNTGSGSIAPLSKAIDYAVDNGADIINISMVGQNTPELTSAIQRAYQHGVVIVAAAGNDMTDLNQSPLYPICVDEQQGEEWVIGVSAIQKSHQIAQFSNSGSDCVDITAPGVQMASTILHSPGEGLPNTYADGWNGTSFATPLVSGTAALIKSLHPGWGAKEIIPAILSNTHKTPPQNEQDYANLFGKGLLQTNKAVAYAASQISAVPAAQTTSLISSYNPEQGIVSEHKITSGTNAEFQIKAFTGVDDAIMYATNNDVLSGVVTTNSSGLATVRVYTKKWFPVAAWSIPVVGSQQIVLADVVGDDMVEVILATEGKDTTVFRIFSLAGKELTRYESSVSHSGVSIAVYRGKSGEKDQLIAVYNNGKNLVIQRFSDLAVLQQSHDITYFQYRGTIAVGDIDGDGEGELVVAAGKNENPFLLYYELDGKIKRQFWAYDPSYRGGLDVVVGDYDGDGKEDVIVSPLSGGIPVRVYNSKIRKIGEWWPFAENHLMGVKLLGRR